MKRIYISQHIVLTFTVQLHFNYIFVNYLCTIAIKFNYIYNFLNGFIIMENFMELVKNIFFNTDKLTPFIKVKISYTGKFFDNDSRNSIPSLWIRKQLGKHSRYKNGKN